jgi:hypothetical protein
MGKQYVTLLWRGNKNGKRNAVICSASWFEQSKATRQKKNMTDHKTNYNKTTYNIQ